MEQVDYAVAIVTQQEKKIILQYNHNEICTWLEDNGWRWLGGRWANLKFPSNCNTYDLRAAVRLEILWQLCCLLSWAWSQPLAKAIIDGSNRRGK